MNGRIFTTISAMALGIVCIATVGLAETKVPPETKLPTQGPGLKPGWPSWYIAGTASDPQGPFPPADTGARVGPTSGAARAPVVPNLPPPCSHSPICEQDGSRYGGVTDGLRRVDWLPTTKWTYAYPFELPAGGGDVSGVGVDSKDNVWVWQRNQPGNPALFKFGPDHKLLLAVSPDLTDHSQPFRGHGMGVDAEGNAWVLNEIGQTVKKFSPDGKLLMTLGTKGHRGDWNEAAGQRLLWDPVTIGFGPGSGDVYIFEGHGDEAPNDVDSDDPTNIIGVSRVLHLDKNGKFINQWYGNDHGPGKFTSGHGSAVDPVTGDIWVGDREFYRIAIFSANGHFIRTLQMRNLICAMYFDNHPGPRFGQIWLATGQDGQVVRIDRNGNVLEVAGGNRKGKGPGQFSESTNMSSDSKGNLIVADTQIPRATELSPPAKK